MALLCGVLLIYISFCLVKKIENNTLIKPAVSFKNPPIGDYAVYFMDENHQIDTSVAIQIAEAFRLDNRSVTQSSWLSAMVGSQHNFQQIWGKPELIRKVKTGEVAYIILVREKAVYIPLKRIIRARVTFDLKMIDAKTGSIVSSTQFHCSKPGFSETTAEDTAQRCVVEKLAKELIKLPGVLKNSPES